MKKKLFLSLFFKFVVIISAGTGVVFNVLSVGTDFNDGPSSLLYFTLQSNIWILIYTLFETVLILNYFHKHKLIYPFKRWQNVLKIVFTTSITLTGIVFIFMLAPTLGNLAWTIPSILLHVIVPVFAISDLLVSKSYNKMNIKFIDSFYSLIPPSYYLILTIIGFNLNFDYAYGNNFPYFFLNFTSPAGIFGFSDNAPYYMGSFYWVIILSIFVYLVSVVYIWIMKTHREKNRIKKQTM